MLINFLKNILKGGLVITQAFLLFLSSAAFASGAWQPVGQPGFSEGIAKQIAMTVDRKNNIPYVLYVNEANGKASVKKFDGNDWVNVGDPVALVVESVYSPAIAIDSKGTPYIAYANQVLGGQAMVKKFDGDQWVSVGALQEQFLNERKSIVFDKQDTLYLLNNHIVKKFDGDQWVESWGGDENTGGVALTIGPDNNPYVAYAKDDQGHVVKFDGRDWVSIGKAGFPTEHAIKDTHVAVDSLGTPYVVFLDDAPGRSYELLTMKFTSNNWMDLNNHTRLFSPADFDVNFVIAPDDAPHIAFQNANHYAAVLKFNGVDWIFVGSPGEISRGYVAFISLAFDNNPTPYIAFLDGENEGKLTVMRFVEEDSRR
jgi:hypothetical protein